MKSIERERELIGLIMLAIAEYLQDNKIQMSKAQLMGCLDLCKDKILKAE